MIPWPYAKSQGIAEVYRIPTLVISFFSLWNVLITFSNNLSLLLISSSVSLSTLSLPLSLSTPLFIFYSFFLDGISLAPGDD